jgi:hypothetical protein
MKSCEAIKELLRSSSVSVAKETALCRIPYPDPSIRGFQGGCSDGERYFYQVLMHYELSDRTKDYSRIAKIDLRTNEVVRYSEILHLDHANDIAYHPGKHLLIVVNNKPNPRRVTFVDPETLTVVGSRELSIPIYALEYNEAHDLYVAGISGKREFRFLDADLNPIDDRAHRTTEETDRYTKQGICADDNFLYFILWDGKHKELPDFQNTVAIYGWDGSHKGYLHFDIGPYEPESISIANGEILAVCVKEHDPMLYRFEPTLP